MKALNASLPHHLELLETLDSLSSTWEHSENIKPNLEYKYQRTYSNRPCHYACTYRFTQRSALSHCNLITLLHTESWRDVRGKIFMTFLVSGVFRDEVEVFAANDESTVHLSGDNSTGEDTAADGDFASEGAFLV